MPASSNLQLPIILPISSLQDLLRWYRLNLCGRRLTAPRGKLVVFEETDIIHLIKLTTKYGVEPKNRRMAVAQIDSGRLLMDPARIQIQRAQELSWARAIVETPDRIVPNWQVFGRANPGDAFIKNFGTSTRAIYRVLICSHEGSKRRAVTIFPRERFAGGELSTQLWP